MRWQPIRKQLLRICVLLPVLGMIYLCLWAAGQSDGPYDPLTMGIVGAFYGFLYGGLSAALLRSIIHVVDHWDEPRLP